MLTAYTRTCCLYSKCDTVESFPDCIYPFWWEMNIVLIHRAAPEITSNWFVIYLALHYFSSSSRNEAFLSYLSSSWQNCLSLYWFVWLWRVWEVNNPFSGIPFFSGHNSMLFSGCNKPAKVGTVYKRHCFIRPSWIRKWNNDLSPYVRPMACHGGGVRSWITHYRPRGLSFQGRGFIKV